MLLLNHLLLAAGLLLPAALGQTPPGFCPSINKNLEVTYPKIRVTPGILGNDTIMKHQPKLHLRHGDKHAKYVIIMVDISVILPNSTTGTSLLHWYQPGLTLSSTGELEVDPKCPGPAAEYIGPAPPEGVHRYVYLLYRQPEGYEFPGCYASVIPATPDARIGFDLKTFVKVAGLGKPLAANWIRVPTDTPSATKVETPTVSSVKEVVCATGFQGNWVKTEKSPSYGRLGRSGGYC